MATITIEELRRLATDAGHYIDSEVHDFICYVESIVTPINHDALIDADDSADLTDTTVS
jgi:hypothetical protein